MIRIPDLGDLENEKIASRDASRYVLDLQFSRGSRNLEEATPSASNPLASLLQYLKFLLDSDFEAKSYTRFEIAKGDRLGDRLK